jgi:hypothetical protein
MSAHRTVATALAAYGDPEVASLIATKALEALWLAGWHVVLTPALEEQEDRTFLGTDIHPTTVYTVRAYVDDVIVVSNRRAYPELIVNTAQYKHLVEDVHHQVALELYKHLRKARSL